MPWEKDKDGKGYSIEQSELDHQPELKNECPSKCGGFGVNSIYVNRNKDGDWTYKTGQCAKCGANLTIFND